jgi:signal transduction histidine kinase
MRATDRLVWDLDLMDSRQVLAAVLDGAPLHLALVGRDGTILATNEAWDRFCRENEGDLHACGPEINYLEALRRAEEAGEEEAGAAREQLEAALAGEVSEDLVYRCDAPDEERTFRCFVFPMLSLDAALVAHASVTEERLAAQLHDQLRIGLAVGVRAQLDELEDAATRLVERPSMLRDPRVDELAGRIARSTHQLSRLLEQVLEPLPVVGTAGRPQVVGLRGLVDDVLADSQPGERTVTNDVPGEIAVRAEPSRLALAVGQVVANALFHTPPGTHVRIHAAPEDDARVVLYVDDDGHGIPAYDRKRLLRPFEHGLFGRRGGPGLGLPIVDRLLRLDGERLRIGDRPGGGARFGLPLKLAEAREVSAAGDPEPVTGAPDGDVPAHDDEARARATDVATDGT